MRIQSGRLFRSKPCVTSAVDAEVLRLALSAFPCAWFAGALKQGFRGARLAALPRIRPPRPSPRAEAR